MTETGFSTFNGFAPQGGPKFITLNFDFATAVTYERDFYKESVADEISFIQSVYIYNVNNAAAVTLLIHGTQQLITCEAGGHGIWPVFASSSALKFRVTSSAGGGNATLIQFGNVPLPAYQYAPVSLSASIAAILRGTFSDFSGAIAVGGTSQTAIPANAARYGFIIQNPSSEIEPLYVNFTNAAGAGDSVELLPGQIFPPNGAPYVTTEAVTVNAATSAHSYVAKEFA